MDKHGNLKRSIMQESKHELALGFESLHSLLVKRWLVFCSLNFLQSKALQSEQDWNNFSVQGLQKIYSGRQMLTFGHIIDFTFFWFSPSFQWNLVTNDTSFENPTIELLESGKKLGVAMCWSWPRPPNEKSTSFTRICLEPFMTDIYQVSKLLSHNGW